MANHLYGSSSYTYPIPSSSSTNSLIDQYIPIDPTTYTSSRIFGSDPLGTSSFNYSSIGGDSRSRSAAMWAAGVGVDVNAASGVAGAGVDSIYAGLKRSSSEALYHQSLLGTHNTIGQGEAWYSTNPLVKRPRFQSSLSVFPQRPGEKDCAHYMLTRTCKFGDSCRFDHPLWVPEGGIPDWKEVPVTETSEPLPERPGEQDCPFFLKTQKCKFGLKCKFNHPKDKVASLPALGNINGSQLPERPSEPPCVFYMKTGKCKYGSTCKFHHPKDISIPTGGVENGSGGQIEAITAGITENFTPLNPPFTPAMLHNSKGLPIRPGEVDCPFYLKTGSCKYSATCRYNHPERYAMDPPGAIAATPAFHMNIGLVNPAPSLLQTLDPRIGQTTLGLGSALYPQRPGQMECDYYMKTGACMFGERCKYHHPLDRTAHALSAKEGQQNTVKLTLAGLPRREGAVNCPYYMKTGACKYGATCKFDHPPPAEVMAAVTSQGASTTTVEVKKENP